MTKRKFTDSDGKDIRTLDKEKCVSIIHNKPHKKYIQYLMTKGYTPYQIRFNLEQLSLSESSVDTLSDYYLTYMEFYIRKHHLGHIYSDYKKKIIKTEKADKSRDIILFSRNSVFKTDIDRKNFIYFLKDLELDEMWLSEIVSHYKEMQNSPIGEDGMYLLDNFKSIRKPFAVIESPYRFVVDQMIIEDCHPKRIAAYVSDNYKINITQAEVEYYRDHFFAIAKDDLDLKLKQMSLEKDLIRQQIEETNIRIENNTRSGSIDNSLFTTRKELKVRHGHLENFIASLNSLHHQSASSQKKIESNQYYTMMNDVVGDLYGRFNLLKHAKDRDVVAPLTNIVKTMGYAMEKAIEFKDMVPGNNEGHTKSTSLRLVMERTADIETERIEDEELRNSFEYRVNAGEIVDKSSILGIDELNVMEEEDVDTQREDGSDSE